MRSFQFFFLWFLLLLFTSVSSIPEQDLTAKEIIKRADEQMRGKTSEAAITIKIIRPSWSREMDMKAWTKGEKYTMILIKSPAKEKGIVFLKRENEVWNWIPTIERNIKLPPSMMSQSWMGTDFTNDDLVKESSSVSDYSHKLLGEEIVNNKSCYKIEMIPKPSAAIVWEKVIVWIDKIDFLQFKAEFYDEDGTLVNIMKSGDVKVMGNRKITSKIEMIPVNKSGQSTVIIYNSILFDKEISEDFFTVRNMKRIN